MVSLTATITFLELLHSKNNSRRYLTLRRPTLALSEKKFDERGYFGIYLPLHILIIAVLYDAYFGI